MENGTDKIIIETIKKNKILGIVYTVDGVEYCDWLQPSEVSANLFNNDKISVKRFIVQNTNVLPTKEIFNQINNYGNYRKI